MGDTVQAVVCIRMSCVLYNNMASMRTPQRRFRSCLCLLFGTSFFPVTPIKSTDMSIPASLLTMARFLVQMPQRRNQFFSAGSRARRDTSVDLRTMNSPFFPQLRHACATYRPLHCSGKLQRNGPVGTAVRSGQGDTQYSDDAVMQ